MLGLPASGFHHRRRIRLTVLPRIDRSHLESSITAMAAPGTRIKTDGLRGYLSLGSKGFLHERVITKNASIPEESRWLYVAVSNTKALIGGTYHGLGRLGGKHLQAYLDEYAYRFNRRHRPDTIFDRCVAAVVACPIWTYRDIVGKQAIRKKSNPDAASDFLSKWNTQLLLVYRRCSI